MKAKKIHVWPDDKFKAMDIQRTLADDIEISDNLNEVNIIAAVDTAYGNNAELIFASAVVTTFPEIEEIEKTGMPLLGFVPEDSIVPEYDIEEKALTSLPDESPVVAAVSDIAEKLFSNGG